MSKRYWTDLSETEWQLVERYLPPAKPRGRKRKYPLREIFNAILYLDRAGCSWRLLPKDFPPYRSVFGYFTAWKRDGTFQRLQEVLHLQLRVALGREPEPSVGIIDSQSVKTTQKGGPKDTIGTDVYKKVSAGRKRHLLVDTLGYVLAVVVHSASIQDKVGAYQVLAQAAARWTRLLWIWADGGYEGEVRGWAWQQWGWFLGLVKRPPGTKGWQLLPKRWIVERTFGWLGQFRRLSKDYEFLPETSETMIRVAMIHLLLRRLTRLRNS